MSSPTSILCCLVAAQAFVGQRAIGQDPPEHRDEPTTECASARRAPQGRPVVAWPGDDRFGAA